MFHGNFWSNIEMNLETGALEERANLLPTPESLFRMADPEWMVEALHDDLALQMSLYAQGVVADVDVEAVRALAGHLGVAAEGLEADLPPRELIRELLDAYSLEATRHVLGLAREFCAQQGKELLVVLLDPFRVLDALVAGEPRYDEPVVRFLQEHGYRVFDMNLVHVEDFASFSIPFAEYMKRYSIGHYSPAGNHFFAYALRPLLVDWLDPKPITYEESERRWIDFDEYLRA
jgi:hypothetical protein